MDAQQAIEVLQNYLSTEEERRAACDYITQLEFDNFCYRGMNISLNDETREWWDAAVKFQKEGVHLQTLYEASQRSLSQVIAENTANATRVTVLENTLCLIRAAIGKPGVTAEKIIEEIDMALAYNNKPEGEMSVQLRQILAPFVEFAKAMDGNAPDDAAVAKDYYWQVETPVEVQLTVGDFRRLVDAIKERGV